MVIVNCFWVIKKSARYISAVTGRVVKCLDQIVEKNIFLLTYFLRINPTSLKMILIEAE